MSEIRITMSDKTKTKIEEVSGRRGEKSASYCRRAIINKLEEDMKHDKIVDSFSD